jgi:DNA-3-methyladenine glycosylase
MSNNKLTRDFYLQEDVVALSKALLGKIICTQIHNQSLTSGIIVETEAYRGRNDKACHANNGLRTERTEVMYKTGGTAYIYLCYGIHHLFNVVTNKKDKADAVLVRAIQPVDGKETMLSRRNKNQLQPDVTAGPGRLTEALGITTGLTGTDLTGETIWIEERDNIFAENSEMKIQCTPRIGVDYAGDHARRPWRFLLKESKWISK